MGADFQWREAISASVSESQFWWGEEVVEGLGSSGPEQVFATEPAGSLESPAAATASTTTER